MRSTLILIALLGIYATGCGSKSVVYDPKATVAFDKDRDTVEKLGGPKGPKKDGMTPK